MAHVDKQYAPFFGAWDSYLHDIEAALERRSKKGKKKPSSKRFHSLVKVDDHFKKFVKLLVKRYYDRVPVIHKYIGDVEGEAKDFEIYMQIKNFWDNPYKRCTLSPPRVAIIHALNNEKDVWEACSEYCLEGVDRESFFKELDPETENDIWELWKGYRQEGCTEYEAGIIDFDVRKLKEEGRKTLWRFVKECYREEKFREEIFRIGHECEKAVEALIKRERSLKREPTSPYLHIWTVDKEERVVFCDGKGPIKLEPRLFGLFHYLLKRKNKWTPLSRIKKNFKIKARYERVVHDRVNKLIYSLDSKANVLGLKKREITNIIEKERVDKVLKQVIIRAL